MARSKRKRLRDYRHELPIDGPGWQKGSEIRRIQWTVLTKMQDLGHDESIPYMLGGIDAATIVFDEYLFRMVERLISLHDLFTEKTVASTPQSRWYNREAHITTEIVKDVQALRTLLASERGIDPRPENQSHSPEESNHRDPSVPKTKEA